MDGALFQKDLYASREEALNTAERISEENRIQLYAYKCPHGGVWHLSKSVQGGGKKGRA